MGCLQSLRPWYAARSTPYDGSTKGWRLRKGQGSGSRIHTSVVCEAISFSSAAPPIPRPQRRPIERQSPSRRAGRAQLRTARVAGAGQALSIDRCPADAHAVLVPALEGFSPTLEMPEIAQAQVLLTALAATDEVKVDAAHRQRLTQLQVAYGNALIAARGTGAPETTEAFARPASRRPATRTRPNDWRPMTVCGAAATCVESCQMREYASAFLSDVEARPNSPETGVAHRAAGMTCWFAGEYREARDHLERAFALFQPGRDDDLAFRFGYDPGVGAMASLAIASWPLGEVDRAISLIDRMQTRMASLTHVGTLANGRIYAALFELMRGNSARAAPNVFELARLAREQVLPMWGAVGVFLEGWAAAASGCGRQRARGHAPRRRAAARTERSVGRRSSEDCAG